MMSAEFPEINPEPFCYPCASYNGNVEDFVNEVEEKRHSSYSGLAYSDATCPQLFADPNRHSLLLQELTVGQDHHLLHESQEREGNGRNSYSCEPNIHIKILMKEPRICLDDSATNIVYHPLDDHHTVQEGDCLMGGVTVQVECADESHASVLNRTTSIEDLAQNLLAANRIESAMSSLSEDFDSPTPTPSYVDQLTTPSAEFRAEERIATCGIRGGEVAELEESRNNTTDVNNYCEVQQSHDRVSHVVGDEEVSLHRRRTTHPHDSSLNWFAPLIMPRRRLGSTLLQHFPAAHHMLLIPPIETRKLSDSAICMRRAKIERTTSDLRKQRCLSDTATPNYSFHQYEDEERGSSALGCDSGFQEDKGSRFHESASAHFSSPRMSLQSLDRLSLDEGSDVGCRTRRVTPLPSFPLFNPDGSQSDDMSGVYQSSNSGNAGTMVHPRDRTRRSLMKHYSQGSISGVSVGTSSIGASSDSPSLSSLLDCQSNVTGVTDLLSSLGFDDFDSPQLVPDRFIPRDLEYLKPSSMKLAFTEQNISPDPPRSPDSLGSGQSSNQPQISVKETATEPSELPLGATAENFLDFKPPRPSSPIPTSSSSNIFPIEEEECTPAIKSDGTPLFTDTTAILEFTRSRILETVPEETASDLSPSPRWFSPRVSIDHSVHLDFSEGKHGTNLNVQKVRKRSLPNNREGYRWSIGSLVESDTGDSIHLSVTSYDDMIAAEREKERESLPPVVCDDNILGLARRRRIGVYNPPQTLLSWLSTQKTIDEEVDNDPEELPWPFNEQAHLRKSLTEISLAQKLSLSECQLESSSDDHCCRTTSYSHSGSQCDNMSMSPASTPNARCSPQPATSDDEDQGHQVGQSCHHKEELEKASSPTPTSSRLPPVSLSDFTMLSSGLEPSTNSSTISLLQTERGSLATLSSDHSLTGGLTHNPLHVLPDDEFAPPGISFLSKFRSHELPIRNSDADTSIFKEDHKYSLTKLQEPTLHSRHSCSALKHCEEVTTTDTVPEDELEINRRSSHSSVLHRGSLQSLVPDPTGHLSSIPTSCSIRRKRFAERKPKSLDEQQLPPASSAPAGRVRRKAVYGAASHSPLTELLVLSPGKDKFNKELKEVEKYMIL